MRENAHQVRRKSLRVVPVVLAAVFAVVLGVGSPAVASAPGIQVVAASSELGYRIGTVIGAVFPIALIVLVVVLIARRKSRPKQ